MKRVLIGLFAATCLLAATTAQGNLLLNGGFEDGNFNHWTQSGNLGFTGVGTSPVHSGTYSAFLGPVGSDGFLSQTFAVVPGAFYNVSFWLYNAGGTPNNFSFSWAGSTIALNNAPAFGWTQLNTFVLAPTGSGTVTFGFRNDPAFYYLDDVSVTGPTPVPEPTTVLAGALLLLPFGASTLRILRKRTA